MKLSKRLKQIESLVTSHYDHIWDCCCDHGFLGASLLARQAATDVHFVDIVPELMAEVESKLQRFFAHSESRWHTHCIDVAKLPLSDFEGKHLIIIAGVGGDLMTHFVESIHSQYPESGIDFLLCPVHHQFTLRSKLIELDFSLKKEILLEENKRFYEILMVSSQADNRAAISPVGEAIWQSDSHLQTDMIDRYLDATLKHYTRIQDGKSADVQNIIDAYKEITIINA